MQPSCRLEEPQKSEEQEPLSPPELRQARTSFRMSRISSKDTGPELTVRRVLHQEGYRFRLHRRDLPGSPDIVLPRFKTVVFIHGCFWHGHDCKRGKLPRTNAAYWRQKVRRTMRRDRVALERLQDRGWRTHVIWSCEIEKGLQSLLDQLQADKR